VNVRARSGGAFLLVLIAAAGCGSATAGAVGKTQVPHTAATTSATSAPPPGATARSAGQGPVCTASQLKISMAGGVGGLGQQGGVLSFANTGSTTCRLTGWPRLVGITAAGAMSTATPVEGAPNGPFDAPPGTPLKAPVVMLKPGALAWAQFFADDNPVPPARSCPPPIHQLRVTPPANTRSTTISGWLPGIDAYTSACQRLFISPVAPPADFDVPFAPAA
jgi:hypothetical protein